MSCGWDSNMMWLGSPYAPQSFDFFFMTWFCVIYCFTYTKLISEPIPHCEKMITWSCIPHTRCYAPVNVRPQDPPMGTTRGFWQLSFSWQSFHPPLHHCVRTPSIPLPLFILNIISLLMGLNTIVLIDWVVY